MTSGKYDSEKVCQYQYVHHTCDIENSKNVT